MTHGSLLCEPSGDFDITPPTENCCCGMVACVEFACNIDCISISIGVSVQPIENILEDWICNCCRVILCIQLRMTCNDSITKKISNITICIVGWKEVCLHLLPSHSCGERGH